LITTHRLPQEAFMALASGSSSPAVVQQLRGVQCSKHLMLVHAVAVAAKAIDPSSPEISAFRAGHKILATVQEADPDTFTWLFSLPHMGAWAHDCLVRQEQGLPPDFGYLASAAAAAAIRAGIRFELDVPVRDGRVLLPGLGVFQGFDQDSWVRLYSDAGRLNVGELIQAPCAALLPGNGSADPVPRWAGTHVVRAEAEGRTWTLLLETADRHLDRFALPMSAALTAAEVKSWQACIQSAWEVLVRHHNWVAGSLKAGVSVIVPLFTPGDADLSSATTPAAFGAIATTLPPDPVIMAEILVHEFQHLVLCALQDMDSLLKPCDERVYAPWRPDPRPVGGLLQGIYAHLGIARFWSAQRHVEAEPDDILRAEVMFARWRSMIEPAASTLLRTGCLTPTGTGFVELLRDQGQLLESAPVAAEAQEIATQVGVDHWATWQLRHVSIDATAVTEVAAAYRAGAPVSGVALPEARIEEDTRKVDSTTLSRLLAMRFLEPRRYRELSDAGMPGHSEADRFLLNGEQPSMAVQAYREEILTAPEPRPDAWAGLAVAIHQLAQTPLRPVFATRLPLMFDVHALLIAQGVRSDPLELAAWFG
jgi:HEXXH motif-containing protein